MTNPRNPPPPLTDEQRRLVRNHFEGQDSAPLFTLSRASLEARITELERRQDALRALMAEAVRDFHGKSVLFSTPFLNAAKER